MTYAEYSLLVDQYNEDQKDKEREMLYLAWHVAAFSRQKELQPLQDILRKIDMPDHQQTPEEMFNMCKMLNALHGGQVVEG